MPKAPPTETDFTDADDMMCSIEMEEGTPVGATRAVTLALSEARRAPPEEWPGLRERAVQEARGNEELLRTIENRFAGMAKQ